MKNNKGFTLIELLVAIAIMGIVVTMVSLIMGTSSRTYAYVSTYVQLQQDAQLAMSHVQENILDCNSQIEFDLTNKSLTLTSLQKPLEEYDATSNPETVSSYVLDGDRLNFGADLLAKDVVDFDVELTENNITQNIESATVTIEFSRDGREYEVSQTIAIRNQVTD